MPFSDWFAPKPNLEETVFNLKLTVKQMERESKKASKLEAKERKKVAKAIADGNLDIARIHGESAVRKKNESLNYLRMGSRLDGVASKISSAIAMQNVTKDISQVSKGLASAMKSMNLTQVADVMANFTKQDEDMQLRDMFMQDALGQSMGSMMPAGQVDSLLQEVADENALVIQLDARADVGKGATEIAPTEEAALKAQLAAMRAT